MSNIMNDVDSAEIEESRQTLEIPSKEFWKAVETRNHDYDTRFVFGVNSTKIYCMPSCPSRRPNREQVVFFSGPSLAERAGFRACLRCRPNVHISSQRRRVEEACKYIDENPDRKLSLKIIGEHVGMSPFHLQRIFKRIVGVTPRQYAEASKLERAKLWLRSGESVRKSIYRAGHNSTSWLYSHPDATFGIYPSDYRNGGEGMQIYYFVVDCRLGRLLVAATARGVCSVSLGDSYKKLEAYLRNEYPKAKIQKDESMLASWMSRILEYLDGEEIVPLNDLPLDIRATSFQYKVWKELQRIPYGSTRSYSEIARQISRPRAIRAVANACASNPVPLVVPCHRVISKDGSLGGYSLGLKRKQSLLEREQRNATTATNKS